MKKLSRAVILLFAIALAGVALAQEISFSESTLEIETAEGERHRFDIELAVTAQQRSLGLMFRKDLAADAGMLFIYPRPQVITMWMQNTPLPLDMIFIGQDNRIAKIVERTIPYSTATISSGQTVKAVLEVNGGAAERLGFEVGDRVINRELGS
ncbi:MAG: DUF192 domain-containing protein [Rhodovibrionaceae bacterium]